MFLACLCVLSSLTLIVADSEQPNWVLRRLQFYSMPNSIHETGRLLDHDKANDNNSLNIVLSALGKLYRDTTTWDGRESKRLPFGSNKVVGLHLKKTNGWFQANMLPLNESDTVVHIELYFFHQSLLSYGNSTNGFYGPRVSSSVQVELHLRLTDEHGQEVHQLLGAQRTSTVRSGWIKFSLWPHFLLRNSGLNKSRHLGFLPPVQIVCKKIYGVNSCSMYLHENLRTKHSAERTTTTTNGQTAPMEATVSMPVCVRIRASWPPETTRDPLGTNYLQTCFSIFLGDVLREFRFVTRDSTRRVIVTVPARTENAKILGQLYEPYILLYLRQVKHSNDLGDLFRATTFPAESYVSRQAVEVSSKRNLWHSNFHHSGRKNMANLTLLHTDAQKRIYLKRVRRQARYHEARRSVASRTRPRRICSVQSMLVDFAQIGWNRWIISPTHYDARMCVGQCPFPLGQAFHPSNHAVVQMLMHHLDPRPTGSGTAKIHRPCCVPQKLVALHVLYHDQNNHVVLKVYEDMIVESCGCR